MYPPTPQARPRPRQLTPPLLPEVPAGRRRLAAGRPAGRRHARLPLPGFFIAERSFMWKRGVVKVDRRRGAAAGVAAVGAAAGAKFGGLGGGSNCHRVSSSPSPSVTL